jgi:hypothetical protein
VREMGLFLLDFLLTDATVLTCRHDGQSGD